MIINVTRHTNEPDGSIRDDYFGTFHSVDSVIRFMPPRFVHLEDLSPICADVYYTFTDALTGKAVDDPRPVRIHDRKVQAYDGRYFRRFHQAHQDSRAREIAAFAAMRGNTGDD